MTFDEYQALAMNTDLSDELPDDCNPILYHSLKLNGEAGEVAELIGKLYRDDKGRLTDERRMKLEKELGDILWYMAAICKRAGLYLDDVAIRNLSKLQYRFERGTLHGDGDNR